MYATKFFQVSRGCRNIPWLHRQSRSVAPLLALARDGGQVHDHGHGATVSVSVRCLASEVAAPAQEQQEVGKSSGKPLRNVPFVKDLFLGKFDKKMLVYPEVLSPEQLEDLEQMVQPIEKFFFEDLDSKSIDENAEIPPEVLRTVGELGLFGQQIPVEYGGLGLNATEYARLAEITSHDPSIAVTLGAHQSIGLKGILLYGNEQQKAKYLPKLATGEHIAAFALTEPSSGSDAASIQTKATLSEDGKHYLLNGNKIYISNGGIAEVFTVFARTEVTLPTGETQDKVSAFIVERSFGGITSGKPENKLGIRGSNTTEVHFDNTPVPVENILLKEGSGFKIAVNILNSGRFSMGSSSAGSIKTLIKLVSEHAMSRKQFGKRLMDFGLIQEKIARMAIQAYVMESMAYMTSGVLDSYEEPDAAVEAAIVKVYSSDAAFYLAHEGIQILGGLGYMRAMPLERGLRDSRIMSIFEGTNEILRLFIALMGFQHAGVELREVVKKMKNPLNNMGFLMQQGLDRVRSRRHTDNPRLAFELAKEVHPSLANSADALEKNVINYGYMVENYLSQFRDGIMHEQLALRRFADIMIDMYGMTAVLARASRSISIGQRNHDHEALLARSFCFEATSRIKKNMDELKWGKHTNGDEEIQRVASDIFNNHGTYLPEHPLKRNW